MKILKLRFKNLNSLVGEWEIDFTHPRYLSDGIFAISGPTGAGKSTILDAICLALYGSTPRLGVVSKNTNEIMSRQTGECFSEVLFETQKGQFLCTWSQHRARKKADGKLAEPSHEIALAEDGAIVESKRSKTAEAIEERTGMNFERFTQSMLLAQGGFAAFLQAAPNDRAPILEQITGTEIYSTISVNVFDRQRSEKGKLDLLKAETEGIVLLKQEEEDRLVQDLPAREAEEREIAAKKATLDLAVSWIETIGKISRELYGVVQEREKHLKAVEEFAADRIKLNRALRAFELEGEFATLSGIRSRQKEELDLLLQSESQLPELEQKIELSERSLTGARNELLVVNEASKSGREKITQARALDVTISGKQIVIDTAVKEYQTTQLQETGAIRKKGEYQNRAEADRQELAGVEKYLIANAPDSLLVTELTGIRELLKSFEESKAKYSDIGRQIIVSKKLLETEVKQYKKHELVCRDLKLKRTAAENQLAQSKVTLSNLLGDRQLREYRADHTNLMREMAYLRKIAGLEAERALLSDNMPCPLCGALHHPFADGNVPAPDETEKKIVGLTGLIDQAEKLETIQKKLETEVQQANNELAEAEKKLVQVQHKTEANQRISDNLILEEQAASERNTRLADSIIQKLQPLGINEIPEAGPEALAALLDSRLKNWQKNQKIKAETEKRIGEVESDIKSSEAILRTIGDSMKSKMAEIEKHQVELAHLQLDRNELYGQKSPDIEELRLEKLVKAAVTAEREASEKQNQVKQQADRVLSRIQELKISTSARKESLGPAEEKFIFNIREAGFGDESVFISCRLQKDQRDRLARYAHELDTKQTDIDSRQKDREARLALEKERKITEEPLENLIQEAETTNKILKFISEEIGGIKQRLSVNSEAKSRFSEKMQQIEAQKSECKRWDLLQHLIGSADGKKYRNFAQGLTFELMVSHANRQLSKLTDRYLLIRDDAQPLDLNVIDNYQAGEKRSTKNLSGGESFIVSLALALGLSHMASRKVRVDSLFLDEGFGSLDEETLETALDTLASLRQDGKLIGVISHVPALKERISTQILVQPVSGGKSRIKGPGCRQNRV